jgi:hypothetical protein
MSRSGCLHDLGHVDVDIGRYFRLQIYRIKPNETSLSVSRYGCSYEFCLEHLFFFGKEVHIHIAGLRSRTLHDVRLLVKGGSLG